MHPELFKIPGLNFAVHSYGLMLVLGLVGAMELAKFLARRSGLRPELFSNAAILALVSGLIGARIAYVLQFPRDVFVHDSFLANAWSAINLTSGGLVYYGGFLFAFATLVAWAIWQKLPVLRSMDIIAPCLMIGLGFGRVGCFLNGCCGGQFSELPGPLALQFPYYSETYRDDFAAGRIHPDPRLLFRGNDGRLHLIPPEELQNQPQLQALAAKERSLPVIDTQLISTVTALLIALITFAFFTLYKAPGRGFALMMMLEGITRTLIEGMRTEPLELGPLTLSMVIGIVVFVGGVVLWFVAGALDRRRQEARPGYPEVAAVPA